MDGELRLVLQGIVDDLESVPLSAIPVQALLLPPIRELVAALVAGDVLEVGLALASDAPWPPKPGGLTIGQALRASATAIEAEITLAGGVVGSLIEVLDALEFTAAELYPHEPSWLEEWESAIESPF